MNDPGKPAPYSYVKGPNGQTTPTAPATAAKKAPATPVVQNKVKPASTNTTQPKIWGPTQHAAPVAVAPVHTAPVVSGPVHTAPAPQVR